MSKTETYLAKSTASTVKAYIFGCYINGRCDAKETSGTAHALLILLLLKGSNTENSSGKIPESVKKTLTEQNNKETILKFRERCVVIDNIFQFVEAGELTAAT